MLCPFRAPCHPATAWAAQLCPMMDSASSSFCKYPHRSGTPLACSFHPSLFLMRLLVAALFHLHENAQETNITSCMRTGRARFTGRACRGTTVGMAFCRTALVAPFYGFFFPGNTCISSIRSIIWILFWMGCREQLQEYFSAEQRQT